MWYKSDPTKRDTDGDGIDDEVDAHPLSSARNCFAFKRVDSLYEIPNLNNIKKAKEKAEKDYNTINCTKEIEKIYKKAEGLMKFKYIYPDAASALAKYLSNEGGTYYLDVKEFLNKCYVSGDLFRSNVLRLMEFSEDVVKDGDIIIISSNDYEYSNTFWSHEYDLPCPYIPMLGVASAAMVAEVTNEGNTYTINLKYYVFDYYDWSLPAAFLSFFPKDSEMKELNRAGLAKPFTIQGVYDVKISWELNNGMNSLLKLQSF